MTERAVVPDDFDVPNELVTPQFRLEPLGPQHNESDHAAWTGSIEHVSATAGFNSWPPADGMSLEENRADLERHAADFVDRTGFTYTVLDPETAEVIGCVYLYPTKDPEYDLALRTWVRADRAELDQPLHQAVVTWVKDWPLLGSLKHR